MIPLILHKTRTEQKFIKDYKIQPTRNRRVNKRIPVNLQARFFFENRFFAGTVANISEDGMFIRTDKRLPDGHTLDIVVLLKKKLLKVTARVMRKVKQKSPRYCTLECGIGMEIVNVSQEYLNYVNSRKKEVMDSRFYMSLKKDALRYL